MSAIPSDHDEIIARYRRVAALPDGLFLFTFPLRRRAIDRLHLAPGESVLEVGCGSGANFAFLIRAVGPTGQVVGVDISPEMAAAARARVQRHGWSNVQVVESPAESMRLDGLFDGLLLFARHDVLTSPEAIRRCLEKENESVRLFVKRAALDSPAFTLNSNNILIIAQICHRLDGIPLAIELAAARTSILSVDQILKRLDDQFNLLAGGLRSAMPRHQTLHATIEWSYDLMAAKERILFRRLAVFSRSWTLDAAEAVCSGDGIQHDEILDLISQLVNKSLVVVDAGDEKKRFTGDRAVRYRRLEIIREVAPSN